MKDLKGRQYWDFQAQIPEQNAASVQIRGSLLSFSIHNSSFTFSFYGIIMV